MEADMGPKVQSPPDSLGKAVNQFARAFATEENAQEAKRIAQEFLDHNLPGTSKYLPTDPQIHDMMCELRRGLGLPSGPVPGEVAEHRVPKDYLPLPAENSSGGESALPGS